MLKRHYLFVTVLLLLTGCASTEIIHLGDASTIAVLPEKALAFGRVKFASKGKPMQLMLPWNFRVYILSEAMSQPLEYVLRGDSSFYWHLRPGEYTITSFWWNRLFSDKRGRIFAQFVIPEGEAIVYIGTLTIGFEDEGNYWTRVEDEYSQALQALRSKFAEVTEEPPKSLMHLEKAR